MKLGQKNPDKKKKPLARKKKTTRAKLIKKADKVFGDYMKAKAGRCEFCKDPKCKPLNVHHGVVHRRYMNTRYSEKNCVSVGVGCHYFLGNFPNQNMEFFRKRIGSDGIEELEISARSGRKVSDKDLEEIIAKYERLLEGLVV